MTKMPHCQIKFDIKVKPEATEATYQKALKNINKEVTIPGFRKGRAPDAFIIEKYQSVIQKEFVDLVLQTGFNEAVHLTHVHPLKDGHMKRPIVHECSREKGAHFTLEFEARPSIPSVKLEELQLKAIQIPPVTEKECQNALHNLLLQFATYEPINDRAIQENDFADVSLTVLENPPREVVKKERTQVNSAELPHWLLQKIIGLKPGESAEGMSEENRNPNESNFNFQPTSFQVTVHAIWKGTLPPVDDELAKRVGLQTVEELHKKIRERLEQENEEEVFKQKIEAIETLLIEKYPFDIPQSYIEADKEARLENYLEELKKKGIELDSENYQKIENTIEESTIQYLQIFFLLQKIAAENHITVSQEDVSHELMRQIALMPSHRSRIDFSDDKEKMQEQIRNLAFTRKIKQFLIEHTRFEN